MIRIYIQEITEDKYEKLSNMYILNNKSVMFFSMATKKKEREKLEY